MNPNILKANKATIMQMFSDTETDAKIGKKTCHSAIFIGASKSGKTTMIARILELIQDRYDLILFFSYSLHDPVYKFIDRSPESKYMLYDDFSPEAIKMAFKLNKKTNNALQILIIMDDMIGGKIKHSDVILQAMSRGRNSGISIFLSSQSATLLEKSGRSNVNYMFILSPGPGDMQTTVVEKFLYNAIQLPAYDPNTGKAFTKRKKTEHLTALLNSKNENHGCLLLNMLEKPVTCYHAFSHQLN
jgi:hypothetical protein